ncbi:hypothetical protein WMY93_031987 [Mugilogobius chulae]|uniref:Uncharacterized protein n=1 Tax=Mugilogobius chulae TaxID=88201 RepID=A0AAW0MDC2_9GOBI
MNENIATPTEDWRTGAALRCKIDVNDLPEISDGRMDSPGFSAQYCTYTLGDNDTKKIMSIQQKDKRECHRISTTMEKEAFIQSFNQIRQEVNLAEVCTDAHSQISALFRTGIFKESGVEHTYDMWHGAKNLGKKIHAAGQQKGCSILLQWAKDICNHFWFCCNKANNYDEFFAMWIGLLHHVSREHEWALDACQHDPLEKNERTKEWIPKGSPPHKALADIIMKDRWLKDVPKYLKFRSTAHLEGFHNHLLIYASKRFSYIPPVYEVRMHLAALDYNPHVHRSLKRNAEGNIQYRKVFNKKSKCWSLYAVKQDKDYSYIPALQAMIVVERLSSKKGLPRHAKGRPKDPRRLGLLTDVPAPRVATASANKRRCICTTALKVALHEEPQPTLSPEGGLTKHLSLVLLTEEETPGLVQGSGKGSVSQRRLTYQVVSSFDMLPEATTRHTESRKYSPHASLWSRGQANKQTGQISVYNDHFTWLVIHDSPMMHTESCGHRALRFTRCLDIYGQFDVHCSRGHISAPARRATSEGERSGGCDARQGESAL